jgi:CxxC motif-containing protein
MSSTEELTKVREMVCISCPIGCRLTLYTDENEELVVKGNRCPRGKEYAREEYFAPKRIVTATARTASSTFPRVPVRTDAPLPKEHIDALLKDVYELEVPVPISRGQVIFEDYHGTGVNLTASMSITDAKRRS